MNSEPAEHAAGHGLDPALIDSVESVVIEAETARLADKNAAPPAGSANSPVIKIISDAALIVLAVVLFAAYLVLELASGFRTR